MSLYLGFTIFVELCLCMNQSNSEDKSTIKKGARGTENKFQLPSKHKHVNDTNSAWFTPSNYFNRSTKQTPPTKK
jgi:hypothetical protein